MRIVRSIVVGAVVALLASSSISLGPALADGINWTSHDSANNKCCTAVTYGNGLFVAVSNLLFGSVTGGVMTSPDGQTWTAHDAAEANAWSSIAYGNGTYVAVASSGASQVMTSPDGITWTARTASVSKTWRSVAFGNGLFVAVASDGSAVDSVMTSSDGITWTTRTAVAANQWRSVTYGNGLFVAVATTGTINDRVMTSPDGITWTPRTAAANYKWFSVTYGNGLFVALTNAVAWTTGNVTDGVMTSPDGVTWTAQQLPSGGDGTTWTSVTYGNGLFVAVGAQDEGPTSTRLMTSPDGVTWTARTPAQNLQWRSVTFGAGRFVAVSSTSSDPNGVGVDRVMTSGALAPPPSSTTLAPTTSTIPDVTTAPDVTSPPDVTTAPDVTPPPDVTTVPGVTPPADSTTTLPDAPTPPEPPSTVTPTTAPAPIADSNGVLPRPDTGSGTLADGGRPVAVEVTVENTSDLVMRSSNFELRVSGECSVDCPVRTTPEGRQVITLRKRGLATVSGIGFKPGSLVDVWVFSEPRLLGRVLVAADGTFEEQFPLSGIPEGEHTLQVNGIIVGNVTRSANLGVIVEGTENSLPITGGGSSGEGWALMLLAIGGVVMAAGRKTRRS